MVRDGPEMTRAMRDVNNDSDLRAALVRYGLETIRDRHSCAHRIDDLMSIFERMHARTPEPILESAA
jgi:spore maturation protein CgeB